MSEAPFPAELNLKNKNLTNQNIEMMHCCANKFESFNHIKKLDLSDNNFTGDFPLTTCLRAFPNLETLSINNNTRVTGFAIDKDYKNTTLKVLNVENSGCEKVSVTDFYKKFELETLDLSNSKELIDLGHTMHSLRTSGKMLQVYLRNVVAEDGQLQLIKEHSIIDTKVAKNIKMLIHGAFSLVGAALFIPCIIYSPHYCMQYPIPVNYEHPLSGWNWTNMALGTAGVAVLSYYAGVEVIGGAIARYCLPNGGKVTAVKYITSSVDETV